MSDSSSSEGNRRSQLLPPVLFLPSHPAALGRETKNKGSEICAGNVLHTLMGVKLCVYVHVCVSVGRYVTETSNICVCIDTSIICRSVCVCESKTQAK